jgi:4-hydroxy 2-oxovalerate aldolase
VIDCNFPEFHLKGIAKGLSNAGVDIVEMGFLRGNTEYSGNSTFFTEISQVRKFIPENHKKTMYVLFADYGLQYGMWNFSKLTEYDDSNCIKGIRLGFRKCDFKDSLEIMKLIMDKGYKLFIQTVESIDYSDKELLDVIEEINKLKPYSFGIVDTFGAMYKDDVVRLYGLVDHNLSDEICIDFHSHNNMQLSFAFAQEIVELSRGHRKIIIDATLDGMGKVFGNLNTELIVDFLNRKYGCNYDLDEIFDTIDGHLQWIKQKEPWGYSIPGFMAGIYSSHPNNVKYLTKMHKLHTKDIRYIISMIEPELRKRYDYDNIERLYIEYFNSNYDDHSSLNLLKESLKNRNVLIVIYGSSVNQYKDQIISFVREKNPIVISVNHVYGEIDVDYVFYGNQRRYDDFGENDEVKTIITSNLSSKRNVHIVVNFNKVISRGFKYFDNSAIMLLKLLRNIGIESIAIAGFDGFDSNMSASYSDEVFSHNLEASDFKEINEDLSLLLKDFAKSLRDKKSIEFLTPSRFERIFRD